MAPCYDLTGIVFHRLTVIGLSDKPRTDAHVKWDCLCECGNATTVSSNALKCGRIKSCGCLRGEALGKHRKTETREYRSWAHMLSRCLNPNNDSFKHYGGRGITICERWKKSFVNFLEDMGTRPDNTSLDRINNNGNYEPSNCRWADRKTQLANRCRVCAGIVDEEIYGLSGC